jgi:hypothetical protein
MMTAEADWSARLKAAAKALDDTATAPEWLKAAMQDALAVAEDLAPAANRGPVVRDHIYPH